MSRETGKQENIQFLQVDPTNPVNPVKNLFFCLSPHLFRLSPHAFTLFLTFKMHLDMEKAP
jgi:hypothetical protein